MSDLNTPQELTGSFAHGLYRHFNSFTETKGFPENLHVRLTLATGESFFCRGLYITHADTVPGCVMSHGMPVHSDEAIVIREDHIVSAKISLRPDDDAGQPEYPFEFAAGRTSTP